MSATPKGKLIIIGGHEDREGDKEILSEVAKQARGGRLIIVTAATMLPAEMRAEYTKIFRELGLTDIDVLDIRTREEAYAEEQVRKLSNAKVIFFTGGDQLRITSQMGDSPTFRCMRELYSKGTTIVGTSAGAAVMPSTMIIGGESNSSAVISALDMAPGLGLISDVVIDSHFAERGRIGRLLGAVTQNPRTLGIGIDEDTAIVVERDSSLRVIGSGGVYIVDGSRIQYSSLSERSAHGVLSTFGATLHVLAKGDRFDLLERCPLIPEEAGKERER